MDLILSSLQCPATAHTTVNNHFQHCQEFPHLFRFTLVMENDTKQWLAIIIKLKNLCCANVSFNTFWEVEHTLPTITFDVLSPEIQSWLRQ